MLMMRTCWSASPHAAAAAADDVGISCRSHGRQIRRHGNDRRRRVKKTSLLFVGAANDWNYGVSAGRLSSTRLLVWTPPRFNVVSAAQLMFPFSLSTRAVCHCTNFALQATGFFRLSAVFWPFLHNSVCVLA